MAKYHITADGKPGVCHAQKGLCPFGGDDQHFPTAEQAQVAADERAIEEFTGKHFEHEVDPIDVELEKDAIISKLNKTTDVDEADELRNEIYKRQTQLTQKENPNGLARTTTAEQLKGIDEPDGGASFNLRGETPVTGFMASINPEHSEVVTADEVSEQRIQEYFDKVAQKDPELAKDPQVFIGLWNNPDDHKIYLDISRRYDDAHAAREACKDHDQISYFDLQTFDSVTVDKNAKSGQ